MGHGYRIPQNIPVVSFDNTQLAELMTPRLLKKSVKRIPQDNQVIKSDSCGIF
ncbi:MAG: hypothetical protein HFJ00_15770 [Lachnospiraceae bacterium]|nr:hypothetical protein [Lachnospiraceae bacterium]